MSTTRLVRADSQVKSGGILLNGPNSPPQTNAVRPLPLRIPTGDTSTDSSLSPGMSSPEDTSATSAEEGPTAPMKLRFSTPLPSSGKRRSNSITLGVAARAQLLSQQNAGVPIQRAQAAPQAASPPTWYSGGAMPTDVYTAADARAGLKKAWAKVKRKRRSSGASTASTASTVSTDSSKSSEPPIPEEPVAPVSGEATPRRRPSPPPEEADNTSGLIRRASADPDKPHATKPDVLGFDQERTHDHSTEYKSELWRKRAEREETSSTVSDEESRDDSVAGDSVTADDEEDDAEEQLKDMSRRTSSAAGYEVVERHKV